IGPANNQHIPLDQQSFVIDKNPDALPYNEQNSLYGTMVNATGVRATNTTVSTIKAQPGNTLVQEINYSLFSARKLQPSEYTLNAKLGFISLNQQLNPDQVLGVAYQYTANGQVYNVGEFSDGGISAPSALYLKMLKGTATNTKHPMWDLMMKNIYSIGSYQINPKDFKLDVFYTNSATSTDINYLPVENEPLVTAKPLIQVLSLDNLNQQNDRVADGVFDFIDGVTINANNGRVIFPVTEPFGSYLRSKFQDPAGVVATKYAFDQLYDSTKASAQYSPEGQAHNRFKLKGQYQSSSSSEISLNAPNVPQGSVTVTAGGVQLTENVDYTVDYALGRVKIINEGILNSGTPIKISLESNALFAIQAKTLLATHFDYRISKDFNIGGTIMNLTERPVTKKVNIGDEPISNTIWGLDGNYRTEAPFLTRLVDKIPFIETKEMSTITAAAEYAYLIPGHSKAIGKSGNSYIDDFEGSQSTIDLRSAGAWSLASTPQGQKSLFPESEDDSLVTGFNRAKLAWYAIDPLFLRPTNNLTPANIDATAMSNNFAREIPETEVFPNKQSQNGQPTNIATFDLAYYPSERGQYNFDSKPTTVSRGLAANGSLNNPETRWGGIMRSIQTNDFESANIEYIQFWVMDPFNSDNTTPNSTGDLYFNIGNVSEDVLRDSYKSAENALPAPSTQPQNNGQNVPTDTTAWGIVPVVQPLVNAFNSDPGDRIHQDIGLDGLTNAVEQSFFANYLKDVQINAGVNAYNAVVGDPSADNYHYFLGTDYDNLKTVERYKNFNGVEGNSPISTGGPSTSATTIPNVEDINRDNNLSTVESYFQYHISLKPSDFAGGVGTNYITDIFTTTGQNIKDGSSKPIKWYQFKIPIKTPEAKIGGIDNFQSIRFMRMFVKGADKPVILRFARLELVRGEWRKYGFDLLTPGIYVPNDDATTRFDIAAVNIEENGSKQPVNYVLPPGIDRETNASSANLVKLNEQSMSLTVCNLDDGKSRAAYKNADLDVRS
ncbi:MAG: cell surface protein SprA, partial [Bacteroidetes bacterium]|nr:cell surface protein SprA [Bacteroidota bacterium]